ncbi:MAG: hypothetical protein R3C56_40470 [Pirellulaceae bacterium]
MFHLTSCWQIEDLEARTVFSLPARSMEVCIDLKSTSTHLEHGDELAVGEARLRIELILSVDSPTELLTPRVAVGPTELLTPQSKAASNPMRADKTFTATMACKLREEAAQRLTTPFFRLHERSQLQ